MSEVTNGFPTFTDEPTEFTVDYSRKKPESLQDDETTYPLGGYRQPWNESLIMSNSVFDITPTEDKNKNKTNLTWYKLWIIISISLSIS